MPLPPPDLFGRRDLLGPTSPIPPLDLQAVQSYVWVRYVNYDLPARLVDESEALELLEAHYEAHPLEGDAECFYYGILAYERSFAEPERATALLRKALAAFVAYRGQTSDSFVWDTVEDRYLETVERLGVKAQAIP